MKVVAAGRLSRSMNLTTAPEARWRMTPLPTRTKGAFASSIRRAICSTFARGASDIAAACEAAVDIGHKSRALFVTRGYKTDAALRKRVHDVDVLFPGDPENELHALVFQAAHQELGCIHALVPRVTRYRCRRRQGAR